MLFKNLNRTDRCERLWVFWELSKNHVLALAQKEMDRNRKELINSV